jgi:glutamate carboxypeptidase
MATDIASALERLRKCTSEMVDQLGELVRVESCSSDPDGIQACAGLLERLARDLLGLDAERVEADGAVQLVWRRDSAVDPRVLVVGHFDTVWPRGTLDRWPFEVQGDRATGPGVFDMKSGIVQMFHALGESGPGDRRLPDGVACVLTCDEELGSPSSRPLIERLAAHASASLVLEPSADGALKTARKGTSMYRLDVEGRAAHAGLEPEKGANATVELAHQVLALVGLARQEIGTTVTPTVAASGVTTNTVPAHAELDVDVRAESSEEQQRVDKAVRSLASRIEGTRLVVSGGVNRPPFPAQASESLFELAVGAAEKLGLGRLDGVAVGGGSDGNFTAGLGIPTLDGLGGVGGNAHADGEWVHIPSMPERAALLAELVRHLA